MYRLSALIFGASFIAAIVLVFVMIPDSSFSPAVSVISKSESQPSINRLDTYPNPYSDIQPFMQGIYDASQDRSISVATNTRIIVVPHHLVASKAIATGIASLAFSSSSIDRIVLLSPDHFGKCPTIFCTTDKSFETYFGIATSSAVATSSFVALNRDLFITEHGIYGVLPFIKKMMPRTSITPLVLSQTISWKSHRDELSQFIESMMKDGRTALVVSSDFSHYLSLKESFAEDVRTERALLSQDLDRISALQNPQQSDCPGCLWIATSVALSGSCQPPRVLLHTNSAVILHDSAAPQTTSHYALRWDCSSGVEK